MASNVYANEGRGSYNRFSEKSPTNVQICSLAGKTCRINRRVLTAAPKFLEENIAAPNPDLAKYGRGTHHALIFISALKTFSSGRAFQITLRAAP